MKVNHYDEYMSADDFVHQERVNKLKREREKADEKVKTKHLDLTKLPKENDMEAN